MTCSDARKQCMWFMLQNTLQEKHTKMANSKYSANTMTHYKWEIFVGDTVVKESAKCYYLEHLARSDGLKMLYEEYDRAHEKTVLRESQDRNSCGNISMTTSGADMLESGSGSMKKDDNEGATDGDMVMAKTEKDSVGRPSYTESFTSQNTIMLTCNSATQTDDNNGPKFVCLITPIYCDAPKVSHIAKITAAVHIGEIARRIATYKCSTCQKYRSMLDKEEEEASGDKHSCDRTGDFITPNFKEAMDSLECQELYCVLDTVLSEFEMCTQNANAAADVAISGLSEQECYGLYRSEDELTKAIATVDDDIYTIHNSNMYRC